MSTATLLIITPTPEVASLSFLHRSQSDLSTKTRSEPFTCLWDKIPVPSKVYEAPRPAPALRP